MQKPAAGDLWAISLSDRLETFPVPGLFCSVAFIFCWEATLCLPGPVWLPVHAMTLLA